jgi:hypothetical protein
MTRWWLPDSAAPERRDRDQAEQLPEVEAPPIAETDLRREAIERTRERVLALPDRQ